jgi:predicted phage tail protein
VSGNLYTAHLSPVVLGTSYEIRVRSVGLYGTSEWRTSASVVASGPSAVVAAPSIRSATGGVAQVVLVLDQADDPAATQIEVWRGAANNVASASLITTRTAGSNVTVNLTDTGLAAGTYFYWARSRDGFGNLSDFSAVRSAAAT